MSLLMSNEFVICNFCDIQMFDILLCTRTWSVTKGRCQSIVCFDCQLCSCCLENLHHSLKELKKMKHQEERKDKRGEILKRLKEEYGYNYE